MANFKLNGVTIASESGGAITSALGTVTSGNLSNSAIVHRQGSILQAQISSFHPSGSTTITTAGIAAFGTDLEVSITCASTSNLLLISLHIPDIYDQQLNAVGMHVGFQYSTDSFSSSSNLISNGNDQDYVSAYFGYKNSGEANLTHLSIGPTEMSIPTTTAMKIRPWFSSGGSGFKCNDNHAIGDINTLTVMEVQA